VRNAGPEILWIAQVAAHHEPCLILREAIDRYATYGFMIAPAYIRDHIVQGGEGRVVGQGRAPSETVARHRLDTHVTVASVLSESTVMNSGCG